MAQQFDSKNVRQATRQYDTWLATRMRWELANVHLGTRRVVPAVRRDLAQRKSNWLNQSAEIIVEATLKDWMEWRK